MNYILIYVKFIDQIRVNHGKHQVQCDILLKSCVPEVKPQPWKPPNVLDCIPLIANFLKGHGQDMSFEVNGQRYPHYYLLADGIYSKWTIFVQTIHDPQGEKRQYYAKMQEAARKDVERCFKILQLRLEIIQNPSRQWDLNTIKDILMACVTMHNMIIEDERDQELQPIITEPINVP